ncbi:hypothetical protein [Arthrobacter sp. ISL-28]|uniref:hypothetical protein n=1 Tax=Arthrobacter sp. ISL-28 TaxID=2819108 RepID=UPI001BEAF9A9|nr:hypothetical protein [Arthrobacter sp. ISL-28]MBT2523832.1 hypothetical protein [Arthrobacter sp. ISL-28]
MSKEIKSALPWPTAAASAVLLLPCCLVLLLDLHPGSTYLDHLSSAVNLVAEGILLVLKPVPAPALDASLPAEHQNQLRYALRSGVLPLASLFSDWRVDLGQWERTYSLALTVLPSATAGAVLLDLYGVLRDPAGGLFFLVSAVTAAATGVAAFAFAAVRFRNVQVVEGKLREQIRLLEAQR